MPRNPYNVRPGSQTRPAAPPVELEGPDQPEPPELTTIQRKAGSTTKGQKAGSGSSGSPQGPGTQTEIQDGLAALFTLISHVVRSDARFERSDFAAEAKGLLSMALKLPQLATALGLLGPFVVVAGLLRKLDRIRSGRTERAAREAQAETTQDWRNVQAQARAGNGGGPMPVDLSHIDPATTYKEPL